MAQLKIDCVYCPPNTTLISSAPSLEQDETEWRKGWKTAANNQDYMHIECIGCGAVFAMMDDGMDPDQGGLVYRENMSAPRIDGVSLSGGARTGGEAIYIYGSALDVGNLVVKFGGTVVQQLTNRTATQARVVTPVGQYVLNVATFDLGQFIVGEGVRGADSGARGAVKSLSPFIVNAPTRAFDPNEKVLGDASKAELTLTNDPYSGAVDITVENENGLRLNGGTLVGGFIYA